jgi:hypothetical protein
MFMKKVLVLFLILAVAGGLFAQDVKFSGYVNSGLGFIMTDESKVKPAIRPFGADSEMWGYRFRLNGAVTGKEGNTGVNFRLQSQARIDAGTPNTSGEGYLTLPYMYGWVKLLDGMFNIKGGIVDDSTWQSDGAILADDPGEGLGALVKISPIEGLDLGTGVYVLNTDSGNRNSALMALNFGSVAPTPWNTKYVFSAGYTAKDLLKISASARLRNKAGQPNAADYSGRQESAYGILNLKLLAVEDLTAVLEGEFDQLNHFNNAGVINIYETLGYKIGDLGLGLNAVQYFSQVDDSDIGLRFNPWVQYAIGSIVPRLDLVYFLAGVPDTNYKYHRKNYKASSGVSNSGGVINDEYWLFTVRPSVKFNINSTTFIEVGDLISYEKGPDNTWGGEDDSRLSNAFYVDFKWSF